MPSWRYYAAAAALFGALALSLPAIAQVADFIFTNGKVYTVNPKQLEAQAVAVKGEKIIYVGSAAGANKLKGAKTKVVDLKGGMLLPGFVDNHIHVIAGTLIARGVNLQTDSREEVFTRLREYVRKNPKLKVIVGYGWRFNVFSDPTKEDLDKIESKRPVFLWAVDGHKAWVNSKALELAKITKTTKEPVPGYSFFKRTKDGTPTGYIIEVPAQILVLSRLTTLGQPYARSGLDVWLPRLSSAGITTVFDAGIQGLSQDDGFKLILDYERRGKLPLRIFAAYYWNSGKVDPIPILKRLMSTYKSKLIRVQKLKINLDGDDDTYSALLVDPYSDKPGAKVNPIRACPV